MAIAYVEHPVTKEEKASYRKEFDRVVDIRFAPEKLEGGDKVFTKSKELKEGTVDWLKAELNKKEISFDDSAKKADLEKLLSES